MAFGSTPVSTTVLGTNEFPASSVYIQGTAGGNFTAVQGGPASSADASGNISAPMAVYVPDGNDLALGTTTDASSANTLIGLAKAIKANTASVVIGSGTITANIGTTGGLALDTSINGILLSQGSATSGEKGPLVQGAVTTAAPSYTTAQTSPLSLTTAGALRVDASATTQPVSGTITANAGSGTFNIQANASVNLNQVGSAAITLGSKTSANSLPVVIASDQGAVPVSGTFWQATQPVSGTVTANAGTGTFTNQQSNNTADYDTGAGTQTMTMWGIALPASGGAVAGGTSSNPVRIDPTGTTTQPVSGTITANAGTGNFNNASIGATAAAVPASATYVGGNKSGNLVGLSLDTNGNLNVNVAAGGGSGGTSSSFSAAFPATGTAAGASDGTNMKPLLVDASGFLKVNVAAGGGSGGTSSSFGAAFPATGTAAGWSDGTNMQGPRVFDADTGAGTQYVAGANIRISGSGGSIEAKGQQTMANSLPVAIASDQGAVPASQSGSWTVTANAGTNLNTSALALDTSVNGILLAQASTTSGEKGPLVQGAVTTAAPTYTTAQTNPLSLTTAGALRVDGSGATQPVSGTVTANAGSGTFTVAGTITANAGTGTFTIQQSNVTADYDTGAGTQTMTMFGIALPASGGAVAGGTATNPVQVSLANTGANATAVKVDGSAVTQPVSGTVTANIGTTNGLALDASVTGLQVSQASTTSGQKGSLMQGAVTTNAPTYTTGQTDPLSLDTSGNLRVSLKDTPTNTNNLNVNLAASAATVTVSGTVTANAGTNLNTSLLALESGGNLATLAGGVTSSKYQTNVAQVGGSNVVTAATGVQKVGIVGNAGATLDSTVGAGTAPTNALVTGAIYNSSAPAPTSGQAMALQADQAGNLREFPGIALLALAAWNSATSLNATQTIFTNSGALAVLVQLTQTTTITAGAITFEVSYDGSTWVTVTASQVTDPTSSTYAQIALPYTLQASTNKYFLISNNGWQGLRIKLSTQITGTGTVTPNYALLAYDPIDSAVVYSPTAANFQAQVGSNTATGSAVPANAFYEGGIAKTALPTAATDGNLTGAMVDKFGRQIVMGGLRELKGTQHTTITSTTAETTIVTAGGVGVFCDLYCLVINNSSATACNVTIKDATAGTTRFVFSVPAGDVRGFSLPQDSAHPQASANNNWTATCSASVASIDVTALFVNNK